MGAASIFSAFLEGGLLEEINGEEMELSKSIAVSEVGDDELGRSFFFFFMSDEDNSG